MILAIGEILLDIFPDGKRPGGAPFNFAFHLKSLGLPVIFVTRVGNDENGNLILNLLKKKGFDLKFIQTDTKHKTGYAACELNAEGVPCFNIVKDAAFDYLRYSGMESAFNENIEMIYYGTLIQRSRKGSETLMRILGNRKPETKCFYDMNLRPGCYSEDMIKASLAHCDILKLNQEESEILKKIFGIIGEDAELAGYLMDKLAVEWVSLTKGKSGSTLFTPRKAYSVHIREDNADIADTVGAGDAYSAILAAGYLSKWDPQLIVERASGFAGEICRIKGAIPDDDRLYKKI